MEELKEGAKVKRKGAGVGCGEGVGLNKGGGGSEQRLEMWREGGCREKKQHLS